MGKLGDKFDKEKSRWSLIPYKQLEQVVDVLTLGAIKYSDDNWQHVKPLKERYFSAAMRHISAWKGGEKNDPETGLSHMAHAVCCLLFIMWGDDNG